MNFGKEVNASHAGQEGAKEEGHNHGKRERDLTDPHDVKLVDSFKFAASEIFLTSGTLTDHKI